MVTLTEHSMPITAVWDDEHVKALLHFPRFPARLIQQEPWQSWIGMRGGLKAVMEFLQNYPFQPSHRRILDVVLSTPESVADVYADRLNISRSTYFYQLRELVAAITQALNHWEIDTLDPLPQETHPAPRTNLPTPLTALVGVDAILNSLSRYLSREDVHLLTLLGPGGIGKTRLGIELARRSPLEACFVDLTAHSGMEEVERAIADSLGAADGTLSAIKKRLNQRPFLLVLDNFEHILPARRLVAELLEACPRLKIIATSRIALQLYGEHEYVIPPLSITDLESVKGQQLWAQSPAVALFVQRAQSVNPNFSLNNENAEAITVLCQRMEGLPLAIEMAAYQVKYYTPQAMLALSQNRLDFLSQGSRRMAAHQQSMRSLIEWSYALLSPQLQDLLCQLSAFSESFSIQEAEQICTAGNAPSGCTSLIDHSLLEQTPSADGQPRYKMLGLVREFAAEKCSQVGNFNQLLDKTT